MRTFHTGGVATGEDITQGLPRVEELFEARKPKREATLADIGGTVHITTDAKKRRKLIIQSNEGDAETKEYPINYGSKLKVEDGDTVSAGDELMMKYLDGEELTAQEICETWKKRVQKRDLDAFLLPFGYGDGGGGPTRDHIEYLRREADLEGMPRVRISCCATRPPRPWTRRPRNPSCSC